MHKYYYGITKQSDFWALNSHQERGEIFKMKNNNNGVLYYFGKDDDKIIHCSLWLELPSPNETVANDFDAHAWAFLAPCKLLFLQGSLRDLNSCIA